MSQSWLDELVNALLAHLPSEHHAQAEQTLRKLFTGTRFQELLIESMAEHFTVGELLSLARFYRGEGATIASKAGHYMGTVIPAINEVLAAENPELFS
jgi:hypothetical protein